MILSDEILKNVIKYYEKENERIAYTCYIEPLIAKYGRDEVEKYMSAVLIAILKHIQPVEIDEETHKVFSDIISQAAEKPQTTCKGCIHATECIMFNVMRSCKDYKKENPGRGCLGKNNI